MKHANYTIGNRTRNLPACSAVPQLTAPPRVPLLAHEPAQQITTKFGTGGYTDVKIANFLESVRSDSQDVGSRRWPLNPSITEVKTIGATHVLPYYVFMSCESNI